MSAARGPAPESPKVIDPDATHDTLYDGQVNLIQPKRGFRANTDSLLLAAAVTVRPGGEALELGCGCGGALFPAAHRLPEARFTGLELLPDITTLAHQGAALNGMQQRVHIELANAADWVRAHENRFDAVFSNPPFFAPGTITDPAETRRTAYVETLPLEDWLKAMVFAAKPRAPVTVIHRAAELSRILEGFNRWTGEVTVLPIYPAPGEDANRVLVRGRKGLKRGATRLLSGVCLRDADGAPTQDAAAIKQGKALIW
jgi:tRNA1(Val) A37 N6-methylase TrmN6